MITVAKFITKYLEKKKISTVPIFQGGAITNLINEIGKNKKIKYYCPYHEQALAMQIDAMARIGEFSVGFVTSGPGATNLLTGILCSYYDSIPGVFFTGQVGQFHIQKKNTVRQRGFQETDIISIYKSATKYCVQLKKPEDIKYELDKVFYLSQNGRPGPCLIDIPFNIQISKINPKKLKSYKVKNKFFLKNNKKYRQLINELNKKKKILVLAGGGIRTSKQVKEFHEFIKKYKLPFITTWASQDITDHSNPYFYGSVGKHAYKSANVISQKSDLILSLGCRFSPKILHKNFAYKAKIISIDIDKKELDYSIQKIDIKINDSLKNTFKILNKSKKIIIDNKAWLEECIYIKNSFFYTNKIKYEYGKNFTDPYEFFIKFSEIISDNSIIFADAGCNLCWCMQSFRIKYGQRLISAWGNSPMGYSVAASIGPEMLKKKNIYSLIGDGSLLINIQELHFINKNNLRSKIIVLDNKVFGNTKIGSKDYFGTNGFGNDQEHGYYPPDIKKIADCFDFNYFFIKNNDEITSQLKKFTECKKKSILHINISPEQGIIDYDAKKIK
jgi:acetolactate synthase-1/2/3 large subunit